MWGVIAVVVLWTAVLFALDAWWDKIYASLQKSRSNIPDFEPHAHLGSPPYIHTHADGFRSHEHDQARSE